MNLKIKLITSILISVTVSTGCSSENTETPVSVSENQVSVVTNDIPQEGSHVTSSSVCMVNDAYMGKPQLEVPFEGKLYYGCCEMCRERIPKDKSIRYSTDPHTLKTVDKADAYIVLIGDEGKVTYFESKDTFLAFINENK